MVSVQYLFKLFLYNTLILGAKLLDLIEWAKSNLGKVDIRICSGTDLIFKFQEFYETACQTDMQFNGSRCKGALSSMKQTIKRLQALISEEWNAKAGKKVLTVAEMEEEPITAQDGDWNFIKPCTLVHAGEQEWECPHDDCKPKIVYKDGTSFKRHMAKKHSQVVQVEIIRSKCRLPHNKKTRAKDRHTQDQMFHHLSGTHQYEKPADDTYYRGWQSFDNGLTYSPVFLRKDEPDPTGPNGATVQKDKSPPPNGGQDGDQDGDASGSKTPSNSDGNGGKPDGGATDKSGTTEVDGQSMEQNLEGLAAIDEEFEAEARLHDIETMIIESELSLPEDYGASSTQEKAKPQPSNVESSKKISQEPKKDTSSEKIETICNADTAKALSPEKEKPRHCVPEEAEDEASGKHEQVSDLDHFMIEDELYQSSPEAAAENIFREPLNLEEDSDVELGDSDENIQARIQNKIRRFNKRLTDDNEVDVLELPENASFIEECKQYVIQSTASEKDSTTTVSLTTGLLFRYPDSLLRFEVKKDPNFNLSRLLDFLNEDNFLEIRDPTLWITSSAGSEPSLNASRSKEKYKAHRRLRSFLKLKLDQVQFRTDAMSLLRREKIKDNLKNITEEVSQSRTWLKLNSQIESNRRKIKQAKETLNPSSSMNLLEANRKYLASEQWKKRLSDCEKFYDTAMSTKNVTARAFNNFSNTGRHFLMFFDRNRASTYQFLNSEWMSKRPMWFPEDFNSSEFQGLPDGHNFFVQDKTRSPSAFLIKVSAANHPHLKLAQDSDVIVFPAVNEFLVKYRELKDLHFGTLVEDQPFFQSFLGRPLTAVTSGRGSILEEYSNVNGLPKVTSNTLRATLEPHIQSQHVMKTRSKHIASHSSGTGSKFYDKNQAEFRASAIHYVSQKEGLLDPSEEARGIELDEERTANRRRIEEDDLRRARENAKETLEKNARRQNRSLGRNTKLLPENRLIVQEIFSENGSLASLGLFKSKFPGMM